MAPAENVMLRFDGTDGAQYKVLVDNHTDWKTEMKCPVSREKIHFSFAIVTPSTRDGDLKLAKMCYAMEQVHVYHHTYDAKSGARYRITRVGVTTERLQRFARRTKVRHLVRWGEGSLSSSS
jgi:hypothetical protein